MRSTFDMAGNNETVSVRHRRMLSVSKTLRYIDAKRKSHRNTFSPQSAQSVVDWLGNTLLEPTKRYSECGKK